jgi:hypothetical protein
MEITSTLVNYPNTPSVPPQISSFTVFIVNPCLSTSIALKSGTIGNLVAFAGLNTTS